jgi:hypothetical protein
MFRSYLVLSVVIVLSFVFLGNAGRMDELFFYVFFGINLHLLAFL